MDVAVLKESRVHKTIKSNRTHVYHYNLINFDSQPLHVQFHVFAPLARVPNFPSLVLEMWPCH